ncbi:hypothetical protein Q8A67_015832 [Cirrhinus molitorella]|uniref:B30.2/SPRY domain-containing protein n=1 Tax=Cirrhinus molitorella TaxID=172907 RepID=A0AA88PFH2_9TELE|nr:hypothetical protein Q8A67_015832 [Cirrhinus molitorella]
MIQNVQQMIQDRIKKIQDIKHSAEVRKRNTEKEKATHVELFTDLIRSIERCQTELLELMEEKQKAAEKQEQELIEELEQEITELKMRNNELEQLSHTEDHLHLLQICSSVYSTENTRNWSKISLKTHGSLENLRKALTQIQQTLHEKLTQTGDHKNHNTVSIEETELVIQDVHQMIQDRIKQIQDIKHTAEVRKRNTEEEKVARVELFTDLILSIERCQTEVLEMMEEQLKAAEKQDRDLIEDLEQEITELQAKNTELEQLSQTENHLHLLQIYSSLCSCTNPWNWPEIGMKTHKNLKTLRRALTQLQETLHEKLTQTELKWMQQYAGDVTLDPDTAHPNLILSDDGKQTQLMKTQKDVQQMIQDRTEKIQDIKHKAEVRKRNTEKENAAHVELLTNLIHSIERCQTELLEIMEEEQKAAEKWEQKLIEDLEQEITELKMRNNEMEQLSQTEDHLHLLQIYSSLFSPKNTKNWSEISMKPYKSLGTLRIALTQLQETLDEKLTQTELKWIQQYAVDVTLDPDTAYPKLILSDDGKQNHNTVPIEEESEKKKTQLMKTQKDVQQMIQDRIKKIQDIKHSSEVRKNVYNELLEMMEKQQKAAEKQEQELIKELEQEITELEMRNTELEQLSHTEDHLHLLQIYPSLCSPTNVRNWPEISMKTHENLKTLRRALTQLQDTLNEKLMQTELKWMQQYAVDVTLDPDTANLYLFLYDDGKQTQLKKIQKNAKEMIQDRVKKIKDIKHSAEVRKIYPSLPSPTKSSSDKNLPEIRIKTNESQELLSRALTQLQDTLHEKLTLTDLNLKQQVYAEVESEEKKTQLMKTQKDVQQMIQDRIKKIQDIKHSAEVRKRNTKEEKAAHVKLFTDLICSIERCQTELLEMMEEKQKAAEKQEQALIEELEQDITELKMRNTELEQLTHTEDHLHLLQIYSSLCSPTDTRNWPEINMETHKSMATLRRALTKLQDTLNKKLSHPATELKWMQQYAVDVTLELDTAHPKLILSDDGKQIQLMKTQKDVQQMIQDRIKKILDIKNSAEVRKINTEKEKAVHVEVFTDLICSIERCQTELLEMMEEQQKAAEKQEQELIEELEQEITELKMRNIELEQLSHTEDHLHLLQIYSSLCSPTDTRDLPQISMKILESLRRALTQLQEILHEKLTQTVSTELKWIQQYAEDVTLDPETAHPKLIMSDDGKQVTHGDIWQNLPNNPKRFDNGGYVLGKEGFSSGRFYFEVQEKESA